MSTATTPAFKPWSPSGTPMQTAAIQLPTQPTPPPAATLISTTSDADRFVAIVGAAFSGKTTFALSFPAPLVLDLDRKIPRAGIETIPFWDDNFCRALAPQPNANSRYVNRRDAVLNWLCDNLGKWPGRTVILDSLSLLETAFHQQTETVEGVKSNTGGGQLFGKKSAYFNDVFALLKSVGDRTIVNAHLAPVVAINPTTGIDAFTGKYKPAISGSFAEKIPTFATSVIFMQRETVNGKLEYNAYLRPTLTFEYAGVTNLAADAPTKLTNPTYLSFCQAVGLIPQ